AQPQVPTYSLHVALPISAIISPRTGPGSPWSTMRKKTISPLSANPCRYSSTIPTWEGKDWIGVPKCTCPLKKQNETIGPFTPFYPHNHGLCPEGTLWPIAAHGELPRKI